MSESTVYDVIVVGAGGAHGSSTLYHLAKRGQKVLGLESSPEAPHTSGSHHGLTRIIRLAYFEHRDYVPILRGAYAEWAALEAEAGGEPLFQRTGCVNLSSPEGECYPGALASVVEHGLEYECLTPAALQSRHPGYQLPADCRALLEPAGGVLCPERAIAAALDCARRRGAEVLLGARVRGWTVAPGPDGIVTVSTSRGTFSARKLVLVPGAWLSDLVPELSSLLTVERQVVAWFDVAPEARPHFTPATFPVFVADDETGCYYGFPADAHGFKIGRMHHLEQACRPEAVDREVHPEDEACLRRAVRRYFPAAAGKLNHAAVCLFTNTPDLNFLVDAHPRHPQVILASACSGHGFKFASVMGAILADLAMQGRTDYNIDFLRFSPQRKGHPEALAAFAASVGPKL